MASQKFKLLSLGLSILTLSIGAQEGAEATEASLSEEAPIVEEEPVVVEEVEEEPTVVVLPENNLIGTSCIKQHDLRGRAAPTENDVNAEGDKGVK